MMTTPPTCLICKSTIDRNAEIEFPTFLEQGGEAQYMTHARCFDRVREQLSPSSLDVRAN